MKTKILLSCCGSNNVGQLANGACIRLHESEFGTYESLARVSAGCSNDTLSDQSVILIAVDGCEQNCTRITAEKMGLTVHCHLCITELGIEKKNSFVLEEEHIQLVMDGIQACSIDTGKSNLDYLVSKSKCPCFS